MANLVDKKKSPAISNNGVLPGKKLSKESVCVSGGVFLEAGEALKYESEVGHRCIHRRHPRDEMRSKKSITMMDRVTLGRLVCWYSVILGLGSFMILATSAPVQAQNLLWAKRAGSGGIFTDQGNGVAVDSSGNSYVTGFFMNSATFAPGEANETTLNAVGSEDMFVAKYSSNGALLWVKQAGGTLVQGLGIAVDNSGNCYVTGLYFLGSATFGQGETNQTTLSPLGSQDFFVAKYDSNGALVWAKAAGGMSGDEGFAIAVDSSGNSYVTGFFVFLATFGQGEANETTLTSAGSADIFVAKYGSNGTLLWAKRAGGTVTDQGSGIGVDSSGNSYVTGVFEGTATFGPGEANQTMLTSTGNSDVFIAKYNSNGALLWAKRAGGNFTTKGSAIAVDSRQQLRDGIIFVSDDVRFRGKRARPR